MTRWITLNEPHCFIGLGLHTGEHAPGDTLGFHEVLRAAHHALLAHGRAVKVIREYARRPALVGWSPTGDIPCPADDSPDSLEAAREWYTGNRPDTVWNHTWWNDPVFLGRYPEDGLRLYGDQVPRFTNAEMAEISQPVDFYGTNNYRLQHIVRGPDGKPLKLLPPSHRPLSHNDWNVDDDLLYWASRWPWERYGKPVVFTENGFTGLDWVNRQGTVPDGNRIDYLDRVFRGLARAVSEGIDVRGYFHWSLMDNLEWNHGYRYRFGLVHVDYATQRRTPKDSALWYRDVIRENGARFFKS